MGEVGLEKICEILFETNWKVKLLKNEFLIQIVCEIEGFIKFKFNMLETIYLYKSAIFS